MPWMPWKASLVLRVELEDRLGGAAAAVLDAVRLVKYDAAPAHLPLGGGVGG